QNFHEQILFIDRIACSASLSVKGAFMYRPVLFQEVQHHNNEFAVVDFGIVVAIFAIIGLWSDLDAYSISEWDLALDANFFSLIIIISLGFKHDRG
ncbi:hypothetical protein ACJX0J_016003, partial [Zea mays]